MNAADQTRFANLLSWGQQQGATLHPRIEVYKDDVTGFSLRVKDSCSEGLPPGFTAVTCPASTTLSYLNALNGGQDLLLPQTNNSPAAAFPSEFMATLPPHVIGRFFLMQQYLLGQESFWAPYISSLPQPEHLGSWALPAFWSEEDLEFLEGTNAATAVEEIKGNLRREFKDARRVLKESGMEGWREYSRVLYNWAFAIFTSRSFRPGTVMGNEVRGLVERGLGLGTGVWDEFSVLLPVFDLGNHEGRARVRWEVDGGEGRCELVCLDGVGAGEQVFNNYGMKTNGELLLGYRFIVPEGEGVHNDYVHVRKRGGGGGGGGNGGEAAGGGDGKPKDFLISLRPMLDASSLVGRARQQVKPAEGEESKILPEFAHIEDGLIWDLALAQAAQDEDVARLIESGVTLRRLLASPTEPELVGVVDKIKQSLLAKLYYDYERLKEVEVDEDGEARLVPTNANQELACAYRRQCEKVLVTVLRLLHPGNQGA